MFKTASTVIGGLLLAGLVTGAGAFITVSLLSYRADAAEERIESHDVRLDVVERNQTKVEFHTRILRQDSAWTQRKLDAVLHAIDVPVPDKPPLPPSDLEVPPHA